MKCLGILGWSADSRVRAYPAPDDVRADKAVRAPIAAFVQSALLAAVLLAWLVWSATPLSGEASEARYRVIKIIEGTGTTVPEAGGINQKGQVVGSIHMAGHPNFWLWSDGVRQDLPFGNGRSGLATAINNLGHVVGAFYTGEFIDDGFGNFSPVYHAFVQTDGVLEDLGTLGGWNSSTVWINDQGVVLGAADAANDRIPFINRNGQMLSLRSLISNPTGWTLALETHYADANGRIWGLGTYSGKEHIYQMTPESSGMYRIKSRGILEGLSLQVFAFNEYGQGVGRIGLSGARGGGFLWDEKGLVFLDNPDKPVSFPYAVNNLCQVAGMFLNDSQSFNAFIWERGVKFNLNDLIPPDSGIVLTKAGANAINDAGNIVCEYATFVSGHWRHGVCLLVPVNPIPLQISHYKLTPAGLHLEVQGGAGQPLALEYTSDWTNWLTFATKTNLIGKRIFVDPDARSATFRAFRARLLTP